MVKKLFRKNKYLLSVKFRFLETLCSRIPESSDKFRYDVVLDAILPIFGII